MPGKGTSRKYPHGKSIKNSATYDALRSEGMSKTQAAIISNGILRRGVKKGKHHGGRKKG